MPQLDPRIEAGLRLAQLLNRQLPKRKERRGVLPLPSPQSVIVTPQGQVVTQGGGGGNGGGSGGGGGGGGDAPATSGLGSILGLAKNVNSIRNLFSESAPAASSGGGSAGVLAPVGSGLGSAGGGAAFEAGVNPTIGGLSNAPAAALGSGAAAGFSAAGPGIAGLGAETSIGSIGAQTAAVSGAEAGATTGGAAGLGAAGAVANLLVIAAMTSYASYLRAKGSPKTDLRVGFDKDRGELTLSHVKGDSGVKDRDVRGIGQGLINQLNQIRRDVGGKFNPDVASNLDEIFNLKAKGDNFRVPVEFGKRFSFGRGNQSGPYYNFSLPDAIRYQMANALRSGFITGDKAKIDAKIAELEDGIFDRELNVVDRGADIQSGAAFGFAPVNGPALTQANSSRLAAPNIAALLQERGLLGSQLKASEQQISQAGLPFDTQISAADANKRIQQNQFMGFR